MERARRRPPTTIEEYLALCAPEVRRALSVLLQQIRKAAPGAEELISYGMPGFRRQGVLVWFAAQKNHCALYARPMILDEFPEELRAWRKTKSAVHFTPEKPLPAALVRKIVKAALRANESGPGRPKAKRKAPARKPVKASKAAKVADRYDNGQVRFKGAMKDGRMHGAWVFFRRDGSKMRSGSFDSGVQVGVWKTFARDGRLVKQTNFPRRKRAGQ